MGVSLRGPGLAEAGGSVPSGSSASTTIVEGDYVAGNKAEQHGNGSIKQTQKTKSNVGDRKISFAARFKLDKLFGLK